MSLVMTQRSAQKAAERRVFTRLPYRIPCEFVYGGARLAGIVTEVAARGIFVETSHRIPAGTGLRLLLRDPRGTYEVMGHVMRERRSHRAARIVRASGIGVALETVPEPFFRLLLELGLG
jgi:hypothetical protein